MSSQSPDRRRVPRARGDAPPVLAFVSAMPGEGKTTVASAIAAHLRAKGLAVGVMVPVAFNCRRERTRLLSPDAELLAHHADAPEDLAAISPHTQEDGDPPWDALHPGGRRVDIDHLLECFERIRLRSGIVLVEVHGGLLAPLAPRTCQADVLADMKVEVVVVSSSAAEAFGQTLVTVACARDRGLTVAGVVLNRYEPDRATRAEETNPEWIERHARVPMPTVVPFGPGHRVSPPRLDLDVVHAVGRMIDPWLKSK